MSTLKTTNIQHPSSASPSIVLTAGGAVNMSGATSVTGGGMDLITPTSVAGTGVTLSGGQVTFTAATTISANGVFTSTYESYLVMLLTTASGAASQLITARLRLAGTDAVTNYKTQRLFYSTGATVQVNPSGTDDWTFSAADSTNPTSLSALTIASPAIARATAMKGEFQNVSSTGDCIGNILTGIHTTATAYDGLTILGESGSITGTLRIYGLRNS